MRKAILTMLVALGFVLGAGAQDRTISGRVTDEKGAPIEGVSITSTGQKNGSKTDKDGSYSITLSSKAKSITFSDVNFESQTKNFGSSSSLDAKLAERNGQLDEIVVVGYQSVKKRDLPGSSTQVGGKEVAQKPIVNFTQALQGKAPGVQITGEGGRPGSNAFIRIRGVGSINASSEPLILLDGVQISSQAYGSINPSDIEDIVVLKDAASASIYGSRAANGVLVVTSKRGKGKPELRYSFQYGRSRAQGLNNVRLMNASEKLQYEFEGNNQNANLTALIASKITGGTLPTGTTIFNTSVANRQSLWDELIAKGAGDWADIYLVDATTRTHELALNGQSDKIRYYFSLNKNDNQGVVFGSEFNKLGGRLNVEYQAKDWFKLGTNISLTNSKEILQRELNNTQSSYAALFRTNAYEPVFNANGTYNLTNQGFSPLEGSVNNPNQLVRNVAFMSLFAEIKFLKSLTFKSQVGINYNTLQQESYLKAGSNLAAILGYNQKTDNGNNDLNFVVTNTLNYKQKIGSTRHSIDFLGGQEFNKNRFYSYQAVGRNFPSPNVSTLDNAGTPTGASTSRSDFALVSYFGSAAYDFGKRYFLTGTLRRDGSSRFGKENRFATFWSLGTTWDVLKENFMNRIGFLSALKIKASVGTTGNNNIGNYDAIGVYALNVRYADNPAASPLRLPNPDLTWETNKTQDLSLEFGFLKNRITGSAGYFKRTTNDLLYPVNISQTTGFSSYQGNIGNLVNKGVELELTGVVIKKKNISWSVSGSYTGVDNKITALYSDNVPNGLGRYKVGEPINTFFLVKHAGVNPATGKNEYFKLDGTKTSTYSAGDAVLLEGKSPIVKFYGSLNTNFTYKSFDLSAQLYYSGGNYIVNYMYQIAASNGQNITNNQYSVAFDYWKKAGDVTEFPNLNDATQRITYTTDQYLEKGDYITLRDVTVGYTLDENIAKKIRLKGLRFYVQGTNLYLGTKFRGLPEVGQANRENPGVPGQAILFAYPQARAVTVGFDIKF
jgi:TonB-linked SusC/RagA family outer membrane protein